VIVPFIFVSRSRDDAVFCSVRRCGGCGGMRVGLSLDVVDEGTLHRRERHDHPQHPQDAYPRGHGRRSPPEVAMPHLIDACRRRGSKSTRSAGNNRPPTGRGPNHEAPAFAPLSRTHPGRDGVLLEPSKSHLASLASAARIVTS
jgi:hypothetical protein